MNYDKKKTNYFENLKPIIREYFNILSNEIPEFLEEYINTPVMQKQDGVSVSCGTFYSQLFPNKLWYSSLDHSVAVALIIWHFTKDKKQTLAGLFHDIATPVFKHCIDFMNGDYEKQESTEELTFKMIKESQEIMKLLERDGIKIEKIADYHIYPIADNDTPRLSADRLEYTLSNGLGVIKKLWDLKEVGEVYQNIEIQINEDGVEELGFKDKEIAKKFVKNMSHLSACYSSNERKLTMQFLADIMKKMSENNLITQAEMYQLSEKEVIEKIENCKYENIAECFKLWKNTNNIKESETFIENKYCMNLKVKTRYIVPLVKTENEFVKINQISEMAKQDIENAINFKPKEYAAFDFKF